MFKLLIVVLVLVCGCLGMDDATKQNIYFAIPASLAILSTLVLIGLLGYHLAGEVKKARQAKTPDSYGPVDLD